MGGGSPGPAPPALRLCPHHHYVLVRDLPKAEARMWAAQAAPGRHVDVTEGTLAEALADL